MDPVVRGRHPRRSPGMVRVAAVDRGPGKAARAPRRRSPPRRRSTDWSVRHGGLKLHLLHFYLSLDDLEVRDAVADRFLARAGNLEVSLSPLRLLKGEIPVSRIRIRNFRHRGGGVEPRAVRADRPPPREAGEDGSRRSSSSTARCASALSGRSAAWRRTCRNCGSARGASSARGSTRPSRTPPGEISIPGEGIAAWPYPFPGSGARPQGGRPQGPPARAWGGRLHGPPFRVPRNGEAAAGREGVRGSRSREMDRRRLPGGLVRPERGPAREDRVLRLRVRSLGQPGRAGADPPPRRGISTGSPFRTPRRCCRREAAWCVSTAPARSSWAAPSTPPAATISIRPGRS